jgi:DNA repair photolyase
MLDVYFGEFLINPIPLELSLNYCSHKCAYCFANLNKPGRKLDTPKLMRFLANYKQRETLAALLLKEGYPVVLSNKVDPFSNSNSQQTLPILEVLTTLNIPVQFQTRGGKGIDEAIKLVKPSVWYVSITMLDEALRRQIEPGAPSISSRFELIEKLTEAGHWVVVGLNPYVPEWLPDPGPLLERAKQAGAWGAWIERIHLNTEQIANLSPKETEAITPEIIKRAKKRHTSPTDETAFHLARAIARDVGLEVYSVGQPTPTRFFYPYRAAYPKTFPVMQDFVNYCYHLALTRQDMISFDDFSDFMTPALPVGQHGVSHYLGATARTLWRKFHIPHDMSYKQLLGIIWVHPQTKYSLARLPNFAFAAIKEGGKLLQLVDQANMPLMVFSPYFATYYHEVK